MLSSAEQGAASHRHLLPEGFALLVATGRISRSLPRRHHCCLHTGRRGIGLLTSRPLMSNTNGEAGTHNADTSRACSAQAGGPGRRAGCRQGCRSGRQRASPELRSPARLVTRVPQSHLGYKKGFGNTSFFDQWEKNHMFR